ncbi:hypothetical protein KALB_8265 [Kutzneria albida DSM 43870]|uniref:Uncharacterized protein n=1 Tax=Kutzneria albida DSM 43870 TaxID=1449976 RepID=W5WM82_9PSEU|nr:hypothetical protein KALB_8265 [Kutzneria albida DSM 43870]
MAFVPSGVALRLPVWGDPTYPGQSAAPRPSDGGDPRPPRTGGAGSRPLVGPMPPVWCPQVPEGVGGLTRDVTTAAPPRRFLRGGVAFVPRAPRCGGDPHVPRALSPTPPRGWAVFVSSARGAVPRLSVGTPRLRCEGAALQVPEGRAAFAPRCCLHDSRCGAPHTRALPPCAPRGLRIWAGWFCLWLFGELALGRGVGYVRTSRGPVGRGGLREHGPSRTERLGLPHPVASATVSP